MIYVFPGDLWLTHALQGVGDWLTSVMTFFTWLGYPQAYMIILAIIYWSFDRKLGLRLALFLSLVASLNSILKQAFHSPRPYWVDPDIRAIRVSNGFGMPSGHAQASTVWLYAASILRKNCFWVVAIFTTFLVGLSRIYLGVHFSSQVLIGWLTGLLVLLLFSSFEEKVLGWFLDRSFPTQLILIFAASILLWILGALVLFRLKDWEMPVKWILNAADDLAGSEESILSSVGLSAVAGNSGGFLGVALGALLMHRRGGFHTGGAGWKRLIRSVFGLVFLAAIYGIYHLSLPDPDQELMYAIWRFSGFFILSFSTIFLVPRLFIRVNLLSQTVRS
jgi:membrane-associated phospholipid phosphatase